MNKFIKSMLLVTVLLPAVYLYGQKNMTDGTDCHLPTPHIDFVDWPQGLDSAGVL